LLQAEHNVVLVVEGEKDADNLAALGFVATTNPGGAEKWPEELNQHFRQRDVYILPDNDEPGERHALKVATSLADVAHEIRIVRLPGLPHKGDVSDWLAAGGTGDKLVELMEASPALATQPRLVVSSSEFVAGFVPPDYVLDGILQRRFLYSLTAPTGTGKTAIALLLAASVALGRPIGEHDVERGRVLYLAGENPDDVRMRWVAMSEAMGFDVDKIDVNFVPGVFKLSEIKACISAEIERIGQVSLVIVDTSAAFNEGSDENDNVQMGLHARRMRELVKLPGGPCVVVACHPVKNAAADALLPRGGGAFVAEVDGNLTAWKTDSVVTLHWQGKFRGRDFAPIPFRLSLATTPTLKDSKGRTIHDHCAACRASRRWRA
jgi:AAA domain